MDFKSVLAHLFYLVVYADSQVNDKEVSLGKKMAALEGLDEKTFEDTVTSLQSRDKNTVLSQSITELKKLDKKQQIRCVAWLCVIANGDGFMDKEEWTLIYKIYHTELGLALNEVMEAQKELNKALFGSSFQSIGVRVND
jgi:uncharacterized tellurite resistance protein B-like protein